MCVLNYQVVSKVVRGINKNCTGTTIKEDSSFRLKTWLMSATSTGTIMGKLRKLTWGIVSF